MRINFSPSRSDLLLELSISGDVLYINGEPFDFSPLAEGEELPAPAVDSPWIIGPPIRRVSGEIELTVVLPNAADASEAARFPAPIIQDDGTVEVPK